MNELETTTTIEDEMQEMRHPFCEQLIVDEAELEDEVEEVEFTHYECFRF